MNLVVETDKGRGVDVDDSVGEALDLRIVLEKLAADRPDESDKCCEKIRTATNVGSNTEEGSNVGPLDLRVIKEDKGKRVVKLDEYKKRFEVVTVQTSPLDFSIRKSKEAEQLKKIETDEGKGAVGQAIQRNVMITGERASCNSKPSELAAGKNETGKDLEVNGLQKRKVQQREVLDETAEAARMIVEEMEGEERITDHMNIQEDSEEIEGMIDGETDTRSIETGLDQGILKEKETGCTNGGKEGDKGHRETDKIGKKVSDECMEEEDRQKRKIKESESRSRKRVRPSFKKYRDLSASSRESSISSSSSSSSDSDDTEPLDRKSLQVIWERKQIKGKNHGDERDRQNKKKGPEPNINEKSKLKKAKVSHDKEASSAGREDKKERSNTITKETQSKHDKEAYTESRKERSRSSTEQSKYKDDKRRATFSSYRGRNTYRGRGRDFVRWLGSSVDKACINELVPDGYKIKHVPRNVFKSILEYHVGCLKTGKIPNIEDAFFTAAKVENEKHMEQAEKVFREKMSKIPLPVKSLEDFNEQYATSVIECLHMFRKRVKMDKDNQQEKELEIQLAVIWEEMKTENSQLLLAKYIQELEKRYNDEFKETKSKYNTEGGYGAFKTHLEKMKMDFDEEFGQTQEREAYKVINLQVLVWKSTHVGSCLTGCFHLNVNKYGKSH
ncbi:uncharacterized protein LOC128547804 [Mercenaria mercenaria]|uniref:uncharacterized protein LOC128547804 n=1 Tax=Mercenaria mercenaria TaxID=6596 RepID=UPI00234EF3A8|nr:uncharacterized protein LOC128547804 [Mercenaria mercenaria]